MNQRLIAVIGPLWVKKTLMIEKELINLTNESMGTLDNNDKLEFNSARLAHENNIAPSEGAARRFSQKDFQFATK